MPFLHLAFFISTCTADKTPTRALWREGTELSPDKQPQRAFINPDTGDLIVLKQPNSPNETTLVPATIRLHNGNIPTVRVAILPPTDNLKGDRFHYEYTISNGTGAHDSITNVSIVLPSFAPSTEVSYLVDGRKNGNWLAMIGSAESGTQRELDAHDHGPVMLWSSAWTEASADSDTVNILPGHTMRGFVVNSAEMPGFTTAALAGLVWSNPDEEMDEISERQVDELNISDYFDRTTLTFGPMFVAGADPAEVLKNYRLGVEKLSTCGSVPHNAAFIDEISGILNEPGVEKNLGARLLGMKAKPSAPVELELMNCLTLVARAFTNRSLGGKY